MIIAKKLNNRNLVNNGISVNVLVVSICIIFFNFQRVVNASCIFTDGQVGECVKLEKCRSAILLHQKGLNPGYCSIEENSVCCPGYRSSGQLERRPYTETRPGSQKLNPTNSRDSYEDDSNIQRRKHSVARPVGNNPSGNGYGKKKSNADIIEEPYQFETPESYYQDGDFYNKPSRRPGRPQDFVPPGLAKKGWRGEKTTENDYFYEYVTKKPTRPPSRKNNKHSGNTYESNNPKWTETSYEWSEQGDKRTTESWFNNGNVYDGIYSNKRTTTNRNSWNQGTYTTTRRPEYFGGESGDGSRRPVRPQTNPNRPDYQGSSPGNNRPNYQQGQGNNRPNYQQGQGNNRPTYQQGSNTGGNRPASRPTSQGKRISERKCEEYSKQVIENITGLPLTTNPDPVTISVKKCITPQQLIVGGENTTLGEFPHMAAIGFRDRNKQQIAWNCGGSLISDLFVMTAAHCTSTSSGRPVKVRLGEHNLIKNDDGAHPVEYAVVDIITHPDYRPPSKYNDIALLKLSRKVTFFKHIRPACLYAEETFSVTKAIATGWGRLNYEGNTSEILQKVVLSIIDNQTCNRLYKTNVITEVLSRGIVDSQLCAGELTGEKDTCQGDSGGPLSITSAKCIHHIVGITSFGKRCGLPNTTGVYTRVSAFIPWIESVVWPTNYN